MQVHELIGRRVQGIFEAIVEEQGWLHKADVWVLLDTGVVIGVPYALTGDVWLRDVPLRAFWEEREEASVGTEQNVQQRLLCEPFSVDLGELCGQRIADIVRSEDESENAYILLESGWLFTHCVISPIGTGHAGILWERSVEQLASRAGPITRSTGLTGDT